MKNILLYFGSFNPIHNGHIALSEYAIEQGLGDEVVLVVSPQNPLKQASDLAPEMDRFEMAEIAAAASRFPERIKPSVIEFLLDKPSYTIQTLRHLQQSYGKEMHFSILMGADLLEQLDQWREYDQIVGHYPIYVYPRSGVDATKFKDQITYLSQAPLCSLSATQIREVAYDGKPLDAMVGSGVAEYILRKELWSPETRLDSLSMQIAETPSAMLHLNRGRLHFRRNNWGEALNDFRAALRLNPDEKEAAEYVQMTEEILAFRHKDIYNP